MGIIKFKDVVVYEGPLAEFRVHDNWCDSMATYYPYIGIHYVVGDDNIQWNSINVDAFVAPEQARFFTVELDKNQADDMARIIKARKDKEEAGIVRLHKVVKVVRGRKVPVGTVGDVFWMGDSGFGMSVGIRLLDGSKVFTALRNVEVVTLDKAFEDEILKAGE